MNQTVRAMWAELVATFTLTFIGAGAILVNVGMDAGGGLVAIALAHGLALAVAVYASGHISGGHVNPAVTVALMVVGKIHPGKALLYIAAQCVGAIIACLALKGLVEPSLTADAAAKVQLGATLGKLREPAVVFAIEAIVTFLLVTTIFGVAVDKRGPKNIYGLAIGLTVCLDILMAGPLTGASMNPARSLGPAVVGGYWDIHWVYWAGPIAGGVVAAIVYQFFLIPRDQDAE